MDYSIFEQSIDINKLDCFVDLKTNEKIQSVKTYDVAKLSFCSRGEVFKVYLRRGLKVVLIVGLLTLPIAPLTLLAGFGISTVIAAIKALKYEPQKTKKPATVLPKKRQGPKRTPIELQHKVDSAKGDLKPLILLQAKAIRHLDNPGDNTDDRLIEAVNGLPESGKNTYVIKVLDSANPNLLSMAKIIGPIASKILNTNVYVDTEPFDLDGYLSDVVEQKNDQIRQRSKKLGKKIPLTSLEKEKKAIFFDGKVDLNSLTNIIGYNKLNKNESFLKKYLSNTNDVMNCQPIFLTEKVIYDNVSPLHGLTLSGIGHRAIVTTYHNGNNAKSEKADLLSTLKTLSHEAFHMTPGQMSSRFGDHCSYNCNMRGGGNRQGRSSTFCHVDSARICSYTNTDMLTYFKNLHLSLTELCKDKDYHYLLKNDLKLLMSRISILEELRL